MSSDTQRPLMNGHANTMDVLNAKLKTADYLANFHGDELLADKQTPSTGILDDIRNVLTLKNASAIGTVGLDLLTGKAPGKTAVAPIVASMPNNSKARNKLTQAQVKEKYEKMLHPPLTYLGDAFQYRAADGKFNNVLHPHLGQAGAPYAKTVPSKTHQLGALPDPGDIFDRLMAREEEGGRVSTSGLSSMLIYHATIIIHDIFRTNASDKNISDSSSYLDLSPLYGYTEDMVRSIRDDKYKLGLLKPDTFAEDRLVRQPPGVCIMLVMYNRYHNYAATQLRRINENGRFQVPDKFRGPKLAVIAEGCVDQSQKNASFRKAVDDYQTAWKNYCDQGQAPSSKDEQRAYDYAAAKVQAIIDNIPTEKVEAFGQAYDAAWNKLDDDLFNTARLITCGIYVNISIHDYLRGLMGFHSYDTNFTLDPRVAMTEHKNVSRGIGNQVTVEFNLLYRFHCAISGKDEKFAEEFMKQMYVDYLENIDKKNNPNHTEWDRSKRQSVAQSPEVVNWDPKALSVNNFLGLMQGSQPERDPNKPEEPWKREFGLKDNEEFHFQRNSFTGLFDDEKMISHLIKSMDDPISNFGPRNIPKALRSVEIMGILQARKWEIGTLNDFRDFFGMKRHTTFEDITKNPSVQNALRDLYDHPDKVELYPGAFLESDANKGVDPGPSDVDSALWVAIFSDAITLVRSDRFYTVDWNTNSLTSWGMKEVSPDNDVLKSSVFHRLIQRAFPEWFPYDSIRFFHPFYTAQKNAQFAQEQGYASDFKIQVETPNTLFQRHPTFKYHVEASEPKKPLKPVYLSKYVEVKALLSQKPNVVTNPACFDISSLPPKIAQVLVPGQTKYNLTPKVDHSPDDAHLTMAYFTNLMREIIQREIITVDGTKPIYQIDVTRDLAIPVITRYVADFLGFGDRIRTHKNSTAPYSENEIYQHITNCQVFLSYNADETKMWKRRAAFKTSMQFLFELAQSGNVKEGNKWWISRALWGGNSDTPANHMRHLGMKVAQRILEQETDTGKVAAILLLTALDSAYNSVLAFTAVLNHFLEDLYTFAQSKDARTTHTKASGAWLEIQELALADNPKDDRKIKTFVLEAQRQSVKLPVSRKAVVKVDIKDEHGIKLFSLEKGQTVVCDIYRAMEDKKKESRNRPLSEHDYLTYGSSLSQGFVHFNAKETAVLGLTAMIKVLAQMKNLRRGHDAQGKLKRVRIDQTNEGYANFMAPLRMKKIAYDVEQAKGEAERPKKSSKIFDTRILQPSTETFLTAEWDEMVPFPTTWKVRFDGYGASNYGKDFAMLQKDELPDYFPPFYQPQGPSHYGGSFADAADIEGGKKPVAKPMPADKLDVKMGGCGAPGR